MREMPEKVLRFSLVLKKKKKVIVPKFVQSLREGHLGGSVG